MPEPSNEELIGAMGALEEFAEAAQPAIAPSPKPPPTNAQVIKQLGLHRAVALAEKKLRQEPEFKTVTNEDILAAMKGIAFQPPTLSQRAAAGVGRVVGAGQREFGETFGEAPVTGVQVPGPLGPLVTGPTALAERAFRGIPAVMMGGLSAFEQTLVELGVRPTVAGQLTRDASAALEVTGIITGGRPTLFPGVVAGVRGATRKVLRSATKEAEQAAIQLEKAKRARLRAVNRARQEARELARPGTPESEIRATAVTIAERRLRDVEVQAQGRVALAAPDEIIMGAPELRAQGLPLAIQQRAIKVAQDILIDRGIPPNSLTPQRVQQLVADLLRTDEAFSVRLFADIEAGGMSKTQFIQSFLATGTEAGRTLRARRAFWGEDPVLTAWRELARTDDDAARVVREVVEGVDEAGRPLTVGPTLTALDVGETAFVKGTRIWRELLISLPVTAVRNLIDSGGFRVVLEATQQAVDQTFRRVFLRAGHKGVVAEELEPIGDSFKILAGVFDGLARDLPAVLAGKAGFTRIKASRPKQTMDRLIRMFPEVKGQTFANIELDLARRGVRGEGVLDNVEAFTHKYLLAMNRAQEFIVRRSSLSARLDAELKKIGSSLEEVVDQGRIPAGFNDALKVASEDTLLLTFAKSPDKTRQLGRLFSAYADLIEGSRVLPLLEPFPRFIFNATKLIMENTATGGLRLMRPISRAKLAEGDFSPLARELTGTALMATAIAIRQGEFPGVTPGARFDEVIGPDGVRVSMAPFATIIPHLFLADLIIRLDEGRIQASTDLFKEFRRGLLSSAPQTGRAAEGIEDAFRALTQISTKADFEKLIEFGAESVGVGALRPLTLIRDFRGEWNEAVALQRETRGQGGLAPLLNVFAPEALPERESPTRAATPQAGRVRLPGGLGTVSGPLFSQISGATVREARNEIEREIVVQGFTGKALSPKTGSKRTDALVNRFMGPVLEVVGRAVVTGDLYRSLPNRTKQEVLRNVINLSREPALELAKRAAPSAFELRKIDRMPNNERAMIEEQLDIFFMSSGLKVRTADLFRALEEAGAKELEALGL